MFGCEFVRGAAKVLRPRDPAQKRFDVVHRCVLDESGTGLLRRVFDQQAEELAEIGVKRVSIGSALSYCRWISYTMASLVRVVTKTR